ncbi:MAG: cob(I)yrinic acid a,c-diamide adenosyltransferase [Rhodospirillaceae bacterium]
MVKLNKIYTRTGDEGKTGLGDGTRISKNAARVAAYGEVDEANALIGVALTVIASGEDPHQIGAILLRVQNDLFDLGADLCVPFSKTESVGSVLRITDEQTSLLEHDIDALNAGLKPLTSFVLPGGSPASAHLHHARTVVRSAERAIVNLAENTHIGKPVLQYINRLSDLLFVMARIANNSGAADILWRPGGDR